MAVVICIDSLFEEATDHYALSRSEIESACRKRQHVRARRWIAGELRADGWSYDSIGRLLGGRDHSTIIHLMKAVKP